MPTALRHATRSRGSSDAITGATVVVVVLAYGGCVRPELVAVTSPAMLTKARGPDDDC
jgi:hypothetical protein